MTPGNVTVAFGFLWVITGHFRKESCGCWWTQASLHCLSESKCVLTTQWLRVGCDIDCSRRAWCVHWPSGEWRKLFQSSMLCSWAFSCQYCSLFLQVVACLCVSWIRMTRLPVPELPSWPAGSFVSCVWQLWCLLLLLSSQSCHKLGWWSPYL